MIKRIIYALTMAFKYRKELKTYRNIQKLQSESILSLEPTMLRANGIKIIALDFDGVLAAHGETEINPEIKGWLNHCIQSFGAGNVFILTNKPSKERAGYFANNFKGVEFIFPTRKKPYPDNILFILEKMHINRNELFVVDDRLLTGILATIISGVEGCYITKPIINLKKRPVPELFIMSLRKFERWII